MYQFSMENGVLCVMEPRREKIAPAAVQDFIQEMSAKGVDFLCSPVIFYAAGKWNWMLLTEEGRFAGFRSLGEKIMNKEDAIERVKHLYASWFRHA